MSEREARRTVAAESPLNPLSLCGSYVMSRGESKIHTGLVVAEPQPGCYLIEFYDLMDEKPIGQRVISVDQLMRADEFGSWFFYDTAAELSRAMWDVTVR